MTARKKTTHTAKGEKAGKAANAAKGAKKSSGATKKKAAPAGKTTKKTSAAAKKKTAQLPGTDGGAPKATKKTAAKASASTSKLPAAGPGKKTGKTPAKGVAKTAKTAKAGAGQPAGAASGPAADELTRRWGLVLNGPIQLVDSPGHGQIAFASADVPVGARRALVHPFAEWLAEHDADAAVQTLHDTFELSSADAPFVRARVEAAFGSPAKFEDDREDESTCMEADFVAAIAPEGGGDVVCATFRVTDRNAAAGLRFEDPLPAETLVEALADAFWQRLVEADATLADFTDRTHLEAAGGSASFGVQGGQPFMDEDAMLSDETDVSDIVSRRLPRMPMGDDPDDDDDETAEADQSDDETSTPRRRSGLEDEDDFVGGDDGPGFDDDEPAEREEEEDEDEDDEEPRRRPEDDEDILRMMMSDDDDW